MNTAKLQNLWQRQAYRYLVIGVTIYGLELLIIIAAQANGLSDVVSVGLAFWCGLIISFTGHKLLTFQDARRHLPVLGTQAILYSLLVLWNFGFTLLLTRMLRGIVPAPVSRTLALGVTVIWNFYLYKTRIFKAPVTHETG